MELNVIIVGNDSQRSLLKIKSIEKLEIIAIFQESKEVQDIVYVIQDFMCQKKLQRFFTTGQIMITILYKKTSKRA